MSNILLPVISDLNRNQNLRKETINLNIICLIVFSFTIGFYGYLFSDIIVSLLLGDNWMFGIPIVKSYFIIGALILFYHISSIIIIGMVKLNWVPSKFYTFNSSLFIFYCKNINNILKFIDNLFRNTISFFAGIHTITS